MPSHSHILWHFQNFRQQLHSKIRSNNHRLTFSQRGNYDSSCHYFNDNHSNCNVHVFIFRNCHRMHHIFLFVLGQTFNVYFFSHHLSNRKSFFLLNVNCFVLYFVRAIVCGFRSMGKSKGTQLDIVCLK